MDDVLQYAGWCDRCNQVHMLGEGHARAYALRLMEELDTTQRIDYRVPDELANPRFSTQYLFGKARGQMFGVLECLDDKGHTLFLRAFSCQYNSVWQLNGWVPPVFDVAAYNAIMVPGDCEIKAIGCKINALEHDNPERTALIRRRRQLSQRLMLELHALYVLKNFKGASRPLTDFFPSAKGIPTGAGDCCAPKLLYYAARHHLTPVGLVEFYWGKDNPSGTRRHGSFYSSCQEKCYPILGFMLCGVGHE